MGKLNIAGNEIPARVAVESGFDAPAPRIERKRIKGVFSGSSNQLKLNNYLSCLKRKSKQGKQLIQKRGKRRSQSLE